MKKPQSEPVIRTLLLYLVPLVLVVSAVLILRGLGVLGTRPGPTPLPQQIGPAFRVITTTLTVTQAEATPVPVTPTASLTSTVPADAGIEPTSTWTPTVAATITPTPTAAVVPSDETQTPVDLLKGPDVIFTGKIGEMKLFWQASASAAFRVEWETGPSYASGSLPGQEYDAVNHLYAVVLTGLVPDTVYAYRIIQEGNPAAKASANFRSAPDPSALSLKFVSYGDTRSNPKLHDAVAAQVLDLIQSDPAYQTFNLVPGDLVPRGDQDEYWGEQYFSPHYPAIQSELSRLPFLVARGNHEDTGELFARYFPFPFVDKYYWSFDYGPVHVVLIDQYAELSEGAAQYVWLKQDLETSTKPWKIAVLHMPGWSSGGGHENNKKVQTLLQPLFLQTGVKLVIGGHNHYYARAEVDGITHLTAGTGGAPSSGPETGFPNIVTTFQGTGFCKFEIQGDTLTGTFVDNTGVVQDRFVINK